jgi:hypothetical protein
MLAYVSIRQHTSACVSAGVGASGCMASLRSAVSIRQHTSACVASLRSTQSRMRQHTSAYVLKWQTEGVPVSEVRAKPHLALRAFGCRREGGYQRASALQRTALARKPAYVSIRQHTSEMSELLVCSAPPLPASLHASAYVSTRQHTSTYVSILYLLRIGADTSSSCRPYTSLNRRFAPASPPPPRA